MKQFTRKAHKGMKFDRLTIVREIEGKQRKNGAVRRYIRVKCVCGVSKNIQLDNWGITRSCGCFRRETTSKTMSRHGLSYRKIYNTYRAMLSRCTYEKDIGYKHYGGRGIKVYKKWLGGDEGIKNFTKWALKNGYKPGLQIDRINNDGNYTPKNCRFISAKDNSNNTSRNITVKYYGVEYTYKQFWEKFSDKSIGYSTALSRYITHGYSLQDSITRPTKDKIVQYKNKNITFTEFWEKYAENNVNYKTAWRRYFTLNHSLIDSVTKSQRFHKKAV